MPFEGVLVEAYKGARRKHNMKFRQIGHTTIKNYPKTISAWYGIAFAEAPSLAVLHQIFLTISPGRSKRWCCINRSRGCKVTVIEQQGTFNPGLQLHICETKPRK